MSRPPAVEAALERAPANPTSSAAESTGALRGEIPARARAVYLLGPEELALREVAVPRPGAGEMLVAIEAATTCGTDLKVYRRGGHPRMLTVPGPFGHEMTGRVVAVGGARSAAAQRFREGDAVVVANSASCGRCPACTGGRENLCPGLAYLNGAYADYLLVPARFVERSTYLRPAGLAPEIAAPHALRLETARRLGAAATIHIERSWSDEFSSIERAFEIAIDATGTASGWSTALAATLPGGTTLFFGGCAPSDRIDLATFPIHYDELSLLGCYHHTPRSFRAAIARLEAARSDYRLLLTREETLPNVESALRSMMDRRALKVVIRPA